jgi:hypothetical protein
MRAGGRARTLALLAVGLTGAVYALQCVFFWQGERFPLPAVPLIAAVGGLALAPSAPRLVRGAGTLLVLLAVGLALRGHSYAPPDRDWGEVAGLRELASGLERNAAVLARTNPFFFERFLRDDDADRLWIPLGLCEWQLPIRLQRLRSFGEVSNGSWMREPIDQPLRPPLIRQTVRKLLDESRPVYVWSFRGSDVPFFADLMSALSTDFALERVSLGGRWPVFRVSREPASPRAATPPPRPPSAAAAASP